MTTSKQWNDFWERAWNDAWTDVAEEVANRYTFYSYRTEDGSFLAKVDLPGFSSGDINIRAEENNLLASWASNGILWISIPVKNKSANSKQIEVSG